MKSIHTAFWWTALLGIIWFALLWFATLIIENTALVYLSLCLPWIGVLFLWLRLLDEREVKKCQRARELPVQIRAEDAARAGEILARAAVVSKQTLDDFQIAMQLAVPNICGTCRFYGKCRYDIEYNDPGCEAWEDRHDL